jgi:hypothetical protein
LPSVTTITNFGWQSIGWKRLPSCKGAPVDSRLLEPWKCLARPAKRKACDKGFVMASMASTAVIRLWAALCGLQPTFTRGKFGVGSWIGSPSYGGTLAQVPKPQAMALSLTISLIAVLAMSILRSVMTPVQAGTLQATEAPLLTRPRIAPPFTICENVGALSWACP